MTSSYPHHPQPHTTSSSQRIASTQNLDVRAPLGLPSDGRVVRSAVGVRAPNELEES
jgi:hypothetical protein